MRPGILYCDESQEYYFKEGCYILEISNSPNDPHLSIARARLEPGKTTRLHRLLNTTERYVILQGQGLMTIGNDIKQNVSVGDVAIIPPSWAQCIQNTGEEDLIFLAICYPRFVPKAYEVLEIDE